MGLSRIFSSVSAWPNLTGSCVELQITNFVGRTMSPSAMASKDLALREFSSAPFQTLPATSRVCLAKCPTRMCSGFEVMFRSSELSPLKKPTWPWNFVGSTT